MRTVEMSFTILEYMGVWRPTSWTSKWTIGFYNIINCLILTYMSLFAVPLIIHIYQNSDDIDLLADNMFYIVGSLLISLKNVYIFLYRDKIIAFRNMFQQINCIPRDIHEILINVKFDKIARSNAVTFLIFGVLSIFMRVVEPLTKGKNVTLPIRIWMPYKIESKTVFWITYVYLGLSLIVGALTFVAFETFVSAMMQQVCAQQEMIIHRLLQIPQLSEKWDDKIDNYSKETKMIKNWITHHIYMFKIQGKLNDMFGFIVFVQFFATVLILCTLVYQLSQISVQNQKFWSVSGLLCCYTVQIFFYCWYGEEMTGKSLAIVDAVYKMNWSKLTLRTRKNLIIIMLRASRPLQLRGASIITMSVDTFVKILKTSYTAFNLLSS